ncbi:crossover junction endodeoxyribonuclease RuvC [Candidatus Babeliales bacterium]|nr:crossover junction endodeoxyribonuclease RuvC [Candidatus Babeliales bacterium]
MIILGVDPGTIISGYGVLKKDKQRSVLLDYGFLRLGTKGLPERVSKFHDNMLHLIQTWHVTDIAIETPFLGKNAQNFLKLGYLRGIIYHLAYSNSITLHEFSPREVKQSLTGYGGASKEQVARMLLRLFPGLLMPKKFDVTDALAVSVCGLWNTKKIISAQK